MRDAPATYIVDTPLLTKPKEFDTQREANAYIARIKKKNPTLEIKESMHVGRNRHASYYEDALDGLIDGANTIYKRRALIEAWKSRTNEHWEPKFDFLLADDDE